MPSEDQSLTPAPDHGAAPSAGAPKRATVLDLALRFGPVALAALGLAAAVSSGMLHHLSLAGLEESRNALRGLARLHPLLALAAYLTAYVALVCLSIPGALIMTLAGGMLFGPWLGGLAAATGCTLGALTAYAIFRLAAGDAVDRYAGPRVQALEQGFREDALFYVLTLRLVPVTPFWLVNIAAGLFGVAVRPFLIGSFVGILPASFIYAGLGSSVGALFDRGEHPRLAALFSPTILTPLIALAVLSVLPILYHRWRARRTRTSLS